MDTIFHEVRQFYRMYQANIFLLLLCENVFLIVIVTHSPALPVKKTFLPLSTAVRTAACSLFSLRDGRDRMGFLLGLFFT